MSFLYGISLSLVIAVIFGIIFERLGLLPFAGFLLAGFMIKIISSYIAPWIFRGFDVYSFGYYLIVVSGILMTFEMGREVGSTGFNPRVISFVALECVLIMILSISILRIAGLEFREAFSVGIALLSSSTVSVYLVTRDMDSSIRDTALSIILLESVALLTMLGLIGGGSSNPVTILVFTILIAIASSFVFKYIGRYLSRSKYSSILSIAIALAYSGITESFASPYLGAFIAGYTLQRNAKDLHLEENILNVSIFFYMLSVGIVFPYINIFRLNIFLLVVMLTLAAIAIRAIAIFLTSILIFGDARTATHLSLRMTSLDELSSLVVLTALRQGMISSDIATALMLAPIPTIAIAPILASKSNSIANIVARYIRIRHIPTGVEEVYKIISDIVYTSIKIVGVLLSIAIVSIFLSYISIVAIPIGTYILYRYYKQLSNEIDKLYTGAEIVRYILRFLIVLALVLLTTYILTMLSETIKIVDVVRPYIPIIILLFITIMVIDMVRNIVKSILL